MTDKNFDRSLGKIYGVVRGDTNMTSTLRGEVGWGAKAKMRCYETYGVGG